MLFCQVKRVILSEGTFELSLNEVALGFDLLVVSLCTGMVRSWAYFSPGLVGIGFRPETKGKKKLSGRVFILPTL